MKSIDKRLDEAFSRKIRIMHANYYGVVCCILTGQRMDWKKSVCAHYMRRGNDGTRWDIRNAYPTSAEANDSKNEHKLKPILRAKLVELWGDESIQEVELKARSTVKMFDFEKEELLKTLK